MTLQSDKRQRALGSMDQSKKTALAIYQDAPLGSGPRSFSDSAVFSSELVSRMSVPSSTFSPVYSSTSTEACLQPNTSSESEAKVIADVPIPHLWLGH